MRKILRLPAWMLAEWQAYDLIDPFGNERGDFQAGVIASNVIAPYLKKGAKAPKPGDFMPKFDERFVARRQTPKEMLDVFRRFAATVEANKRK